MGRMMTRHRYTILMALLFVALAVYWGFAFWGWRECSSAGGDYVASFGTWRCVAPMKP